MGGGIKIDRGGSSGTLTLICGTAAGTGMLPSLNDCLNVGGSASKPVISLTSSLVFGDGMGGGSVAVVSSSEDS